MRHELYTGIILTLEVRFYNFCCRHATHRCLQVGYAIFPIAFWFGFWLMYLFMLISQNEEICTKMKKNISNNGRPAQNFHDVPVGRQYFFMSTFFAYNYFSVYWLQYSVNNLHVSST